MAASFKTISFQDHCVANCIEIKSYKEFLSRPSYFSLFPAQWQDSSYSNCPHSTGPLRTSRQHFRSGSHITLMLEASNIPQDRWYASIIGFLGTEGFKHWQHLEISKNDDLKKIPNNMFKAFANTLEVSMSHWNYINEMYSNIRQGEQETTDQLDQCIKILVKRCGYTSAEEKTQC